MRMIRWMCGECLTDRWIITEQVWRRLGTRWEDAEWRRPSERLVRTSGRGRPGRILRWSAWNWPSGRSKANPAALLLWLTTTMMFIWTISWRAYFFLFRILSHFYVRLVFLMIRLLLIRSGASSFWQFCLRQVIPDVIHPPPLRSSSPSFPRHLHDHHSFAHIFFFASQYSVHA